jgi:hypothetical protein
MLEPRQILRFRTSSREDLDNFIHSRLEFCDCELTLRSKKSWGNRGILIVIDEVHRVNRLAQRANCLALHVTSPECPEPAPGQIRSRPVLPAIGASRPQGDHERPLLGALVASPKAPDKMPKIERDALGQRTGPRLLFRLVLLMSINYPRQLGR